MEQDVELRLAPGYPSLAILEMDDLMRYLVDLQP